MLLLECPGCHRQAEVPSGFPSGDARCPQCNCGLERIAADEKSSGRRFSLRGWLTTLGGVAIISLAVFLLADWVFEPDEVIRFPGRYGLLSQPLEAAFLLAGGIGMTVWGFLQAQ